MDVAPHMNPILNFEPTGNSRYTTEFLASGKVLKINHFVQNNSRETRFYSHFSRNGDEQNSTAILLN